MLDVNFCRISLDRRESGAAINFVSHAHTDHISSARSGGVLASDETAELLSAYGIRPKRFAPTPGWIKLLDSGHMLGSKQIFIRDYENGLDYVYTGDFQMQRSAIAKPIEIRKADVVIIDSTYPRPEFKFDERDEVESAMELWIKQKLEKGNVLFGSYPMGKAQELIAMINSFGFTPLVTHRISEISEIHKHIGVKLEYAETDGAWKEESSFIGIVETSKLSEAALFASHSSGRRVYTAVATGFAKLYRMGTDVQFAMSDHADFWQAVDYLNAAEPSLVLTYGHSQKEFADNLSKVGFKAMPFELFGNASLETIKARSKTMGGYYKR
ncbi:MAG: hypothetical protein QXN59_03040 [Candidatus Micrarchaeaceae archaeon]